MFFIVSVLSTDQTEQARQKREEVLDPKDFEKSIDESVAKVRTMLNGVPEATVQETTNFDEVIAAIEASGGSAPGWSAPPKPGQPFRVHGFTIKAPVKDRNNPERSVMSHGFVMLLYYKTADEVTAAEGVIRQAIGNDRRNYSLFPNPAVWYVAYSGYDYSGIVKDKVDTAMKVGVPVTRQFTDRTGSTLREDLK
jgi:hypothetical protein